jgi:hypothetical protein
MNKLSSSQVVLEITHKQLDLLPHEQILLSLELEFLGVDVSSASSYTSGSSYTRRE